MASILELCDEIELALTYYRFRDIRLEIESRGGCVDALEHYVHRLAAWRAEHGLRLTTLALNEVASAAATMLSLGDVGARYAYRGSRILYHYSRLQPGSDAPLTRADFRRFDRVLETVDAQLLEQLVHLGQRAFAERQERPALDDDDRSLLEHLGVADTIATAGPAALRDSYHRLLCLDTPVAPGAAVALGLIDHIVH
jgi:ATP-dependent protease ClpP protease subunit